MSERKLPAPTNHELEDLLLELRAENIKLRYRVDAVEDTSYISTITILGRFLGGLGIAASVVCFEVFDVQSQIASGDTKMFETLIQICMFSIGISLGSSIIINGRRLIGKIRNI